MCSGMANYLSELALKENGIDPADLIGFASTAGKPGAKAELLVPGSAWYEDVLVPQITNAHAMAPNGSHAVQFVIPVEGENDALTGTTGAVFTEQMVSIREGVEAKAKATNGQESPVHMLMFQISSRILLNDQIALAIRNLARRAYYWLVAPTYALWPHYRPDELHFINVGHTIGGAYAAKAAKTMLVDQCEPQVLTFTGATVSGSQVRVQCNVPYPPLMLDTRAMGLATDYGFRVLDGVSDATISSVFVVGDEVVINLSAPPTGTVTVRYGLDYLGSGMAITDGASGNLRDCDPRTFVVDGTARNLWNWAFADELTATPV
jgi:hypothetical protein